MRSIRSNRCADRRPPVAGALIVAATLALTLAPSAWGAGGDEERNAATTTDEGKPAEARRLSARGLAHFEAGRYDQAIADFTASYRLVPLPGLLYNLAQAYRLKGDCALALDTYRRFVATAPPGKIRQKAEARIVEIEPQCPAVAAVPPAALPALVPAPPAPPPEPPRPAPAAPAPAPPPLTPTVTPTVTPTLTLTPAPAPAPPPPPPPGTALGVAAPAPPPPGSHLSPRARRWLGGGGFALAAAACVVSSAYFAGQSRDAAADVSAVTHVGGTWDAAAMQRQQTGLRDEKLALIFGAGALLSAALSLWFIVHRQGGGG